MIPLPTISTSGFVIGSRATIDVSKMITPAGTVGPQRPMGALLIDNESGFTLDCYASQTQLDHTLIPANRYGVVKLTSGETTVILNVTNGYPQSFGVTINPYYINPGEPIPDFGYGGQAGGQIGNQARNVAVPLAPDFVTGAFTSPGTSDMINSVFTLSNAVCAAGFAVCYLYVLKVDCETPALSTRLGVDFSIITEVRNVSNVVLATATPLVQEGADSGQGAASSGAAYHNGFTFEGPVAWPMALGSGPTVPFPVGSTYHLRLHSIGAAAGVIVDVIMAADVDQSGNLAAPGAIGFYTPNVGPY